MPRIKPVAAEAATGKTKELYDGLQKKMGKVVNIFQLMGNSPAVLDAYLQFSGAFKHSVQIGTNPGCYLSKKSLESLPYGINKIKIQICFLRLKAWLTGDSMGEKLL